MRVSASLEGGLASVIVDCRRSWPQTQLCIAALLRHTRRPWELVVVTDPGEAIAAYLGGIRDAASVHVEVVLRAGERGGDGLAAGLEAACGDVVAVVGGDVVVTDGWLDQLSALADARSEIAAVGPMSNAAAPPQRAPGGDYADLAGLQVFAGRWRGTHRGQWFTTRKLDPSCLLFKRHLLEARGAGDIRTPGELIERLGAAGAELGVARDLFVHRFGESPDGGDAAGSWIRAGRSGLIPRAVAPVARRASVCPRPRIQGDSGRAGGRPRVSLTMIVRDEEENLPRCLESAAGLCDEVVVVDTGSTDRTPEVARDHGARVVPFAWVDDFAAARNAALDHATGRYAFWLDADDRIDAANRDRLKALFDRLDDPAATEAGYVMKQLSDGEEGREAATAADHVRLFPLRDDVRWTYRVHEQILPALRAAGVPVRWTEVGIGHVGYVDPGLRRSKLDRNLRLLGAELKGRGGDPFVLFNIGWVAIDRREPRTALGYLRASLAGSAPRDSIVRKLYVLIARAYQMLGDRAAALAACEAGRALEPDDAELLFREALVRRDLGDAAGAEACWRRILDLDRARPRQFSSVSTGLLGHLTRRPLAQLAEARGDSAGALRLWEEVLAECPGDPEALAAQRRLAHPPAGQRGSSPTPMIR